MIDHCPACRYSLAGLPDEHVCPECGFLYERDVAVVEEFRHSWLYYIVFGVLPILMVAWGGARLGSARWVGFVAALVLLPAVLGGLLRKLRPKNAVVVSRKRVCILRGGVAREEFSLSQINHAIWSFNNGEVLIQGTNGEWLHVFTYSFFQSHRRAKQLVTLINEQVTASC